MQKNKFLNALSLVATSLVLSGCMTAVRGTSADLHILTEPPGAKVVTNLETPESKKARRQDKSLEAAYYGCETTPCMINVSRRADFIVWMELEGYHRTAACIESDVQLLPTAAAGGQAGAGYAGGSAIVATATPTTINGLLGTALWAGTALTAGVTSATIDTASGAILGPTPNPLAVTLMPKDETPPAMRHKISRKADRSKINAPDAHAIEIKKREYERAQRCVASLKIAEARSD